MAADVKRGSTPTYVGVLVPDLLTRGTIRGPSGSDLASGVTAGRSGNDLTPLAIEAWPNDLASSDTPAWLTAITLGTGPGGAGAATLTLGVTATGSAMSNVSCARGTAAAVVAEVSPTDGTDGDVWPGPVLPVSIRFAMASKLVFALKVAACSPPSVLDRLSNTS